MKKFLLIFLSTAAVAWTNAAETVTVGQAQFTASGDIDGDGDFDAIIVERNSGIVRIGERQLNGTVVFRQPMPSGVPNVTSMAVGRFHDSGRDSIALTSPLSNRVQLLDPLSPALHPMTASFPAAGPRQLAAFDIAGEGTIGLEDLAATFGFESQIPVAIRRLANGGSGTFGTSAPGFINASVTGWTPVSTARAGGTDHVAFIEQDPSSKVFRLATPTSATFEYPVNIVGVGNFNGFIYGQFDANESDFFFFNAGSSSVTIRRLQPGGAAFAAPVTRFLPLGALHMLRLRRAGADRVLVIDSFGMATIFDYTAADGFLVAQTLVTPDPLNPLGEVAAGAVALGDGSVAVLMGRSPYEPATKFSVFQENGGGGYSAIQFGVPLPPVSDAPTQGGNLFFFAGRPLIDEDPPLVGVWSVADWSSGLTLGGLNQVFGETYLGAAQGLSNAEATTVLPVPTGTIGGLPNQFQTDISFANLKQSSAVLGDVSGGVTFTPEAGRYESAVQVSIRASDPAATIYYRTSLSSFAVYTEPFWLYNQTTVAAYALLPGGERTPVITASYTFGTPPSGQDSDGDGVPDFVEIAKGLDPNGGPDSDGDGYSDLEELLANTDPNSAASTPDPAARPDAASKLFVEVTPRPWDGATNAASVAQTGVEIQCHDVGGGLLGAGLTESPPGAPMARLECTPFDAQQRLLVVSTPAHFDIDSSGPSSRVGREMVGLIAAPDAPDLSFDFTLDTFADPLVEADRWISDASSAFAAAEAQTVSTDLTIDDVLAFVLVEGRIGRLLSYRGIGGSTESPSFTSFRPSEVEGYFPIAVSPEQLLSLETIPSGYSPDYTDALRPREFLASVNEMIADPSAEAGLMHLKTMVREVYRISSSLHNASPSDFPPPLDVLRQFVRFGGYLHSNYQVQLVGLTPEQLSEASSFMFNFIYTGSVRPKVSLDFVKTGVNFGDGKTYVQRPGSGMLYELRDETGAPFELPEAFDISGGTAFHIIAFDDLGPEAVPHPLEVIAIQLTSVPRPSATDLDGNLLADEWERLFFGSTGNDALSSADGSGFTLLQQFFEGTDPTDAANVPFGVPAAFSFAAVAGEMPMENQFTIEFEWPTYADEFVFVAEGSPDLLSFMEIPSTITDLGGGRFRAVISLPPSTLNRFFRVAVRLR